LRNGQAARTSVPLSLATAQARLLALVDSDCSSNWLASCLPLLLAGIWRISRSAIAEPIWPRSALDLRCWVA
jgi:hypothetical protein